MSDLDFDGLADITDAIEQAGGDVKDFDTKEVQDGGLAAMMSSLMGGSSTHTHFMLEVCIPGPTTRDIPDPDGQIDADDVLTAVAVAHHWAEDEGLDELAEDLNDIGNRIGQQATGQAHPSDEMTDFQVDVEADEQ